MSSTATGGTQVVRLAEQSLVPWRNGGGVTRTLLTWPSAADWRVRVSVANIDQSGPFSVFEGVHRAITVIAGDAVDLVWTDQTKTLSANGEPVSFDGGDPPGGVLRGGPTQDLNLMVQGGAGRMHVIGEGIAVNAPKSQLWWGLYASRPGLLTGLDEQGKACHVQWVPEHSMAWGEPMSQVASWRFEGQVEPSPDTHSREAAHFAWLMFAIESNE